MKSQKKLEAEEKRIYLSPTSSLLVYEPGLSHSSQRSFFNYSVIDTNPVTSELYSKPIGAYAVFAHGDPSGKMDFTMKKPDAYLRCTGRYSDSSEIYN